MRGAMRQALHVSQCLCEQRLKITRVGHYNRIACGVAEHRVYIETGVDALLQIAFAIELFRHLPGYCEQRHTCTLGVHGAREGIGGAWPRRDQHDTHTARDARITVGDVHRASFMAADDVTEIGSLEFELVEQVHYRCTGNTK